MVAVAHRKARAAAVAPPAHLAVAVAAHPKARAAVVARLVRLEAAAVRHMHLSEAAAQPQGRLEAGAVRSMRSQGQLTLAPVQSAPPARTQGRLLRHAPPLSLSHVHTHHLALSHTLPAFTL